MDSKSVLHFITAVLVVVYFVFSARAGIRRRRAHWTPASWRAFKRVCVLGAGVMAVGLGMAVAVDLGIYRALSASTTFRGFWVAGIFGFSIAGALVLTVALSRLTRGDPDQQFCRLFERPTNSNPDGAA